MFRKSSNCLLFPCNTSLDSVWTGISSVLSTDVYLKVREQGKMSERR